MNAEDILKKVQDVFKASEQTEEVALSEVITADGLTILFDGVLETGTAVFTTVDGANVALSAGEYSLPDGTKLMIEADGIIASVLAKQETEKETVVATLSKEDVSLMITEALTPLLSQLEELSAVKQENTELKTQLSKEPAAEEIKSSPEGTKQKDVLGVKLTSQKETVGINRVYDTLFGNN